MKKSVVVQVPRDPRVTFHARQPPRPLLLDHAYLSLPAGSPFKVFTRVHYHLSTSQSSAFIGNAVSYSFPLHSLAPHLNASRNVKSHGDANDCPGTRAEYLPTVRYLKTEIKVIEHFVEEEQDRETWGVNEVSRCRGSSS